MKNAEVIAESIKREYLSRLRDEFAAKAMQSALIDWSTPTTDDNFDVVANFSYKMADAMLAARDAD